MYIDKLTYIGLEIVINMSRFENRIILQYNDVFVFDGHDYYCTFGVGVTVEDAAKDYFERIKGKTLILHPSDGSRRQEFTII